MIVYNNMYKRIKRKDNSVIILANSKETKAITFEVLYKVGSRQENIKNNGVSHFLEHLMFKGTKKRPNTFNISKELDSIGAEYNAFTGKDHTGYYIKADKKNLPLAIEMLSDMLHNSKFDKKEMDKERGVIIEEINMYEDNPIMHIEEVFESLMYEGIDLGKSIAGPRKNIINLSRNSLYSYYKKYYYSANSIMCLSGNFNEKNALKLINKFFPLKNKKNRLKIKQIKQTKQNNPKINIVKRNNLEQVQLVLGFKSIPKKDKKFIVTQILANVLGGTMSSRLFLQIREKRGLCYFIKANNDGYEDITSFNIQAGLNKEKIYEALKAIKVELNKIVLEGISTEELQKAKDNIRGRLILKLESATAKLNFYASQELLGERIKEIEEVLMELDKVTLKQVNKIAKYIISWPKSNLAIIGPFSNKNKFLNILKN